MGIDPNNHNNVIVDFNSKKETTSVDTTVDERSKQVEGIVRIPARQHVKYLEFKENQERNRVPLRAKIHCRIMRLLDANNKNYFSGLDLVKGGLLEKKVYRGAFHMLISDLEDALGNKEVGDDMRKVYLNQYNKDLYRDIQRLKRFTTQIKNFDVEKFSGTDSDTLLAMSTLIGFLSPDIFK